MVNAFMACWFCDTPLAVRARPVFEGARLETWKPTLQMGVGRFLRRSGRYSESSELNGKLNFVIVVLIMCCVHVDCKIDWCIDGSATRGFQRRLPAFKHSEPHVYLQR